MERVSLALMECMFVFPRNCLCYHQPPGEYAQHQNRQKDSASKGSYKPYSCVAYSGMVWRSKGLNWLCELSEVLEDGSTHQAAIDVERDRMTPVGRSPLRARVGQAARRRGRIYLNGADARLRRRRRAAAGAQIDGARGGKRFTPSARRYAQRKSVPGKHHPHIVPPERQGKPRRVVHAAETGVRIGRFKAQIEDYDGARSPQQKVAVADRSGPAGVRG